MNPGLDKIWHRCKPELPRLLRFIGVGILSLVLTTGMYAVITRFLWKEGNRTFIYASVIIIVTWINYILNKKHTFNAQGKCAQGAIGRFTTVAIIATVMNNVFFWIGHDIFHVFDLLVILCNTGIIAVFTFSSHRLFTFHHEPWRFIKKPIKPT
ncbi:GtrA family protein [Candidatus Uhrbacteria bacterium]|nr:GtrA family protein [Candidatus Uhrbacteria bacterium]